MYIILLNKLWFDQISCSGKSNTHWRYEVPKWYEILERLRTSGFNAKTLVIDVVENWYLINVSRAWLSTNLTLRDWNCCWRLGGFTWTWTAWYFGHWTGFVDTMLLSEKRVALTWVSVCHSTLNFLNRTFRSELFGSRDFSILVVTVSKHFGQATGWPKKMRTHILFDKKTHFLTNVFFVAGRDRWIYGWSFAAIVAPKISWTNQQKIFSLETYFATKSYQSVQIQFRKRFHCHNFNLVEILHVYFLMQTYFSQRKVLWKKKTANMIQDATVNQHQLMTFIIISKRIKSLSTFCN